MQRPQITRNNHYVPQWYQRGFLPKGKHKLYVLNLCPSAKSLVNSQTSIEPELQELSPKLAFMEPDLYTTRWGQALNDDIETLLFGGIDKSGADAVRSWIAGDHIRIQNKFQDFFEYMDAQKLRTPKGLDCILKHYQNLPQIELMRQMQVLRKRHCIMWSECVREIVSAVDLPVKFIISDHPVTVYNPKLPPDSTACQYPNDPSIELIGSQTIFALDRNHCLILTHLTYAENPAGVALASRRENTRFRGESVTRTDAFIRNRKLTEANVHAFNFILKSRARRYIAADNPAWLYPERYCVASWESMAKILLPQNDLDLWEFGGEVYIGYADGSSAYHDKFGRTSTAHKLLTKPKQRANLPPDAPCGCGGGIAFKDCCASVPAHIRPSWDIMSIRERNLVLIRGINDIFLKTNKTTWLDVRRNMSDDQVCQIHKLYAALWPTDTRVIDLLPSPQSKRSRALFLGTADANTISAMVIGMLAYIDELVIIHPFLNANAIRPEFSPVHHPARFRSQTLHDVFVLLVLEPYIKAGRIHLVPDPLDYDMGFRNEIMEVTKQFEGKVQLGPIDQKNTKVLGQNERMRAIKRLPIVELKAYIKSIFPEGATKISSADIDTVAHLLKKEAEEDPLSLLDPPSDKGDEIKSMKSFIRETGLYMATLTGSFVYTNSDTQWTRLHETDGIHSYSTDRSAEKTTLCLESLDVQVPKSIQQNPLQPSNADTTRALLREIAVSLRTGMAIEVTAPVTADITQPPEDGTLTFKLRASIPLNGFRRTDVSHLVLDFGRLEDVEPVRLALFLEPLP